MNMGSRGVVRFGQGVVRNGQGYDAKCGGGWGDLGRVLLRFGH
jgi:hypothetical protein